MLYNMICHNYIVNAITDKRGEPSDLALRPCVRALLIVKTSGEPAASALPQARASAEGLLRAALLRAARGGRTTWSSGLGSPMSSSRRRTAWRLVSTRPSLISARIVLTTRQ